MNIINEFFVSFILIKLYFKFKVCRKIKFPLLWKFYFSKWKFYFSADSIFTQSAHNPSNFIFKQKSCCANTQDKSKNITINYKELFKESLKNYKKLLPYIVVAVFIGAFIHGFIPQEILQKYLNGNEILSIALAAFLGIFLYLRVETIIPIGLALLQMGISQGVIMSFLIAGAGCSLPELVLLKQMFKIKFLFLFVMIILGVAISFGIFINLI